MRAGLQCIQAQCKQHHIQHVGVRVLLAAVLATSNMSFGCVVWGHLLNVHLMLRNGLQGSCRKLGMLYRSALRWAIAAPLQICGAALCFLFHTIPLHGLITK